MFFLGFKKIVNGGGWVTTPLIVTGISNGMLGGTYLINYREIDLCRPPADGIFSLNVTWGSGMRGAGGPLWEGCK